MTREPPQPLSPPRIVPYHPDGLIWIPRTANRLANMLAAAVIFALIPVAVWAWLSSPAASDRTAPSRSAQHVTALEAGRGHPITNEER